MNSYILQREGWACVFEKSHTREKYKKVAETFKELKLRTYVLKALE